MRKLHIGLFGYSRSIGGISLPRAIPFCSSLYSLGLPPELLGLSCLSREDLMLLGEVYPGFEADLKDAIKYLNSDVFSLLPSSLAEAIRKTIGFLHFDPSVDQPHREITTKLIKKVKAGSPDGLGDLILQAAWIRRFLG
jgi:phosphoenolpyruvate carboxylase